MNEVSTTAGSPTIEVREVIARPADARPVHVVHNMDLNVILGHDREVA